MIVDNWDEVCRENTDVERMVKDGFLSREQAIPLPNIICSEGKKAIKATDTTMFNPMGLACYDIAIATYYYRYAQANNIGVVL
jgi:ornithine cyclodeaminase